MKLGTRLLLPLLAVVALVMGLYGAWTLQRRSERLLAEAHRETQAYAVALGVALEYAFEDRSLRDVGEILDRIGREPKIYGVIVYGPGAGAVLAAPPLTAADAIGRDTVARVLASGEPRTVDRVLGDQQVFSVVRAIRDSRGGVVGAFEVVQPLSFLRTELAGARLRILLNALVLLAAVGVVILWLVRRVLTDPLERFIAAVRALGRGELRHRIAEIRGDELGELAGEFNRMADHVETARTELVREAEERVALERRLRGAEKLAVVGQLAAGLAHEIGAPLHVVAGRAEMLLERDPSPEARERNLRIIVDQIGRITVIVRNLLDFARRREPQLRLLDLASVIDGVADFLEGEFERAGVRLEREGAAAARVHGDPHLLHQVLINLLLNALQAVETADGPRRVVVRLAESVDDAGAGSLLVEVEDTGPGIAHDVLPRLFEPFVSTKAGGAGTGLGLAVARAIVEEHGGRIEAGNVGDAGPRRGAIFRLMLPAAPRAVHA